MFMGELGYAPPSFETKFNDAKTGRYYSIYFSVNPYTYSRDFPPPLTQTVNPNYVWALTLDGLPIPTLTAAGQAEYSAQQAQPLSPVAGGQPPLYYGKATPPIGWHYSTTAQGVYTFGALSPDRDAGYLISVLGRGDVNEAKNLVAQIDNFNKGGQVTDPAYADLFWMIANYQRVPSVRGKITPKDVGAFIVQRAKDSQPGLDFKIAQTLAIIGVIVLGYEVIAAVAAAAGASSSTATATAAKTTAAVVPTAAAVSPTTAAVAPTAAAVAPTAAAVAPTAAAVVPAEAAGILGTGVTVQQAGSAALTAYQLQQQRQAKAAAQQQAQQAQAQAAQLVQAQQVQQAATEAATTPAATPAKTNPMVWLGLIAAALSFFA